MTQESSENTLRKSTVPTPDPATLIDQMPAGIIILKLGKAFEVTYFSPGYVSMMNYTSDEVAHLLGQDALQFVVPEDRELTRQTILGKVKAGGSVLTEYRKRTRTGEVLWVRLRGQVVGKYEDDLLLQCVLMDCTDEKKMEADLIRKERMAIQELEKAKRVFEEEMQYQEATQSDKLLVKVRSNITRNVVESYIAPKNVGISADNMPYDIGSENLAMTGYTKKQQDTIRHLLDARRVLDAYAQGDYQYSVDYQRKTHDGKVIWVNTTVKTYADPETGDVKSFMYSYDIDQEMTLKIMVDKLMAIDYELLAVYWPDDQRIRFLRAKLLDMDYENVDVQYNEFFAKLMKCVASEEQVAAEKCMCIENVYEQLAKNAVFTCSFTFFDSTGFHRKRWQFTFMDESKRAVIVMASDVTELFMQQEKAKEDLRQALELAQEANRVRASFLSRVSHDMRTPLNAILGFSGFAKEETDVAVLHDYIDKIEESGTYLLSLINDTLDINHLQSDTVKLQPACVDNYEVIGQVLHAIEINAQEKGVTFEKDVTNLCKEYFFTDALRLQQVLNNILSNAVKFTPLGGTVRFTAYERARENDQVTLCFEVRDTGIGMSPEYLERIFEPFSQEDDSIRSNYRGTGLGMAIVKRMVDLLGGTIAVESEKGEGTTVTVELTFQTVPDYVPTKEEKALPQKQVNWSALRVLVVEDHPMNYEVVRKLLASKGCKVDWAENGQIACQMFSHAPAGTYPIILMDVRMPVMDGLEATRQIRAMDHPDAQSVKVVMLTANAHEEDREAGMQAGADCYLSKPINPSALFDAVSGLW